jgi:hypothetical protein
MIPYDIYSIGIIDRQYDKKIPAQVSTCFAVELCPVSGDGFGKM